ncbi:hypothetical protein DL546_003817 [Coniochaeta pulveracea]|uniref:Uncharacterized protein n=1 Tax=Coniochaeta pulveracea TaxID=177199 RepID=A0A420XYR5_9PEZI|nr:hypothetical protein DL546_003817 [Coniochaeta pulveracea]
MLVPIASIYQPVKADCTDAYLLHRLELSALACAVRENTVRAWFDKEINKDGLTVEEWSLISALSHIRQETLVQAFARQFVRPHPGLGEPPSSRAPPKTAKERRVLMKVKVEAGRGSPLNLNHPSHIIARMEICGNADGLPSPFVVDVDGYRGQNNKVTGQNRDCRNGDKTDLQQQDPKSDEPRTTSQTSDLFVVGDDSDDEEDLPDEAIGPNGLNSDQGDVASGDDVPQSPLRIADRHKAILCSIRHVPALRVVIKGQPMADDKRKFTEMPVQASVHPDIGTKMTPVDYYNNTAASSPLSVFPDGKSSIDVDGKSIAVTDTFTTPEKPARDQKPMQVLPSAYLCDDDSGYDSDCNDGHLLDLPLTADKLINVTKWKKHLMQVHGAVVIKPNLINNIKALRPGRKAYQDYPDYTVDAWEEDTRDPATIPTVLRMSPPEVESYYISNRPACTRPPPPDAWEYGEAVKAITRRFGVALGGNDRLLAYGLMHMPPQKRQFVMDGLVQLFVSAKAVLPDLPPRTPPPPWLDRPYCQSPLPMTPVQGEKVEGRADAKDAHFTSHRVYPRRPRPPATDGVEVTDDEPAVQDVEDDASPACAPLPCTSSPGTDVEQLVQPEDVAVSVDDEGSGPPSIHPTPIPVPDADNQVSDEFAAVTFAGHLGHDAPPLPFTPSPELDPNSQTLPMDISSTTYCAYRPPSSHRGSVDKGVSGGENGFEDV